MQELKELVEEFMSRHDDLKEFVYRMYKKDIDVFDYKFETVK